MENRRNSLAPGRLPNIKRYVSLSEFAKTMGVQEQTVYRWIREKKLRGSFLIPEDELIRWTENAESREIKKLLEQENRYVQLITRPPPAPKRNPLPAASPDLDFVLGEQRNKCDYLEGENRRLMDQNLRLRSTLRDELLLWEDVLKRGRVLSVGEAGRHVSRLLGSIEYQGRDTGIDPMDYRPREIGGNLSQALKQKTEAPEAERPKVLQFQDAPGQSDERRYFSTDDVVAKEMMRYKARVEKNILENRKLRSASDAEE